MHGVCSDFGQQKKTTFSIAQKRYINFIWRRTSLSRCCWRSVPSVHYIDLKKKKRTRLLVNVVFHCLHRRHWGNWIHICLSFLFLCFFFILFYIYFFFLLFWLFYNSNFFVVAGNCSKRPPVVSVFSFHWPCQLIDINSTRPHIDHMAIQHNVWTTTKNTLLTIALKAK